MELTTDILLKGDVWKQALELLSPFFPQTSQPTYSLFAISASIGIMYDKQVETFDGETTSYIPRTVLIRHNSDLDLLFQSAILTSRIVDFDEKDRMKLAFEDPCDIAFNKPSFLLKFANFGVSKLLEHITNDPIETMEKLKEYVTSCVEGYNIDMFIADSDDLDLDDLK